MYTFYKKQSDKQKFKELKKKHLSIKQMSLNLKNTLQKETSFAELV